MKTCSLLSNKPAKTTRFFRNKGSKTNSRLNNEAGKNFRFYTAGFWAKRSRQPAHLKATKPAKEIVVLEQQAHQKPDHFWATKLDEGLLDFLSVVQYIRRPWPWHYFYIGFWTRETRRALHKSRSTEDDTANAAGEVFVAVLTQDASCLGRKAARINCFMLSLKLEKFPQRKNWR